MNLRSLLPDVSIGRDTSGHLKLSPTAVAVGTAAGRWLVEQEGELVDLTGLVFEDLEGLISKIPIPAAGVRSSDRIVTAERPLFSTQFVHEVRDSDQSMEGISSGCAEVVRYAPPENLLKGRRLVKVFTVFANGDESVTDDKWLPVLPLSRDARNAAGDDRLGMLPLGQLTGSIKPIDAGLLPLLLLEGTRVAPSRRSSSSRC
jgi:hypothetical protein